MTDQTTLTVSLHVLLPNTPNPVELSTEWDLLHDASDYMDLSTTLHLALSSSGHSRGYMTLHVVQDTLMLCDSTSRCHAHVP